MIRSRRSPEIARITCAHAESGYAAGVYHARAPVEAVTSKNSQTCALWPASPARTAAEGSR